MSRMTKTDRLKRIAARLEQEAKSEAEAMERLDGIKDWRINAILQSRIYTKAKIETYLFQIRGEIDREAAR